MTETPLQAIERLIGALRILTRQESHLLKVGLYAEATEVRDREIPLVEKLAELMALPGVSENLGGAVRQRAQSVIDDQRDQIAEIAAQMTMVKEKLQTISVAQNRILRMRPAYHESEASIGVSLVGTA